MRWFSCLAYETPDRPEVEFTILAADEGRARALARREVVERPGLWAVDIHEQGRLLGTEIVSAFNSPGLAAQGGV